MGMAKVHAADVACFKYLKRVVSTKPLSAKAKARRVLGQVRTCVRGFGFELGAPVVRNLSRGRAFFGFKPSATASPPSRALRRAVHICERRVQLAKKISAIVAIDRAPVWPTLFWLTRFAVRLLAAVSNLLSHSSSETFNRPACSSVTRGDANPLGRSVLESLRQPLEDGFVAVARVGGHAIFPPAFSSWRPLPGVNADLLFAPIPVAVIA